MTYADYRPIILMTAGYKKIFRKDVPYIKNGLPDKKPEFDEMIEWI